MHAEPSNTFREKCILVLGSCAGLGFCPVASGTVTVAVLGVPLFWALHGLAWWVYGIILVAGFFAAVALSAEGDRILGEKDSRRMVVDEIVGYLVAVFTLPFTWQIALLSFVLERALDISKVPPARQVEDHVPGGWGVVLDDVVAGLYTLLIMRLAMQWFPDWLGVG